MPTDYTLHSEAPSLTEFRALLTHREFRAADLPDERLMRLLTGATFVETARGPEGELLGCARAISDGAWVTHLSQVLVYAHAERRGIGRALVERIAARSGPECTLMLVANEHSHAFYTQIGFVSSAGSMTRGRLR